jgi:hypothetical protein
MPRIPRRGVDAETAAAALTLLLHGIPNARILQVRARIGSRPVTNQE